MRTPRVLIADDDAALAKAIALRLRHAGYDVVIVADGYSAMAQAVELAPDLLILDINMPAGNGFTVQERLAKLPRLSAAPVIYVTGDTSDETVALARSLGAFGLLHKPFDFDVLLEGVRNALAAPAA